MVVEGAEVKRDGLTVAGASSNSADLEPQFERQQSEIHHALADFAEHGQPHPEANCFPGRSNRPTRAPTSATGTC